MHFHAHGALGFTDAAFLCERMKEANGMRGHDDETNYVKGSRGRIY